MSIRRKGTIIIMRKFVSIILSVLILTISVSTAAASEETVIKASEKCAAALTSLNLFKGTDKGFELDREPLRMECVVTIIRLLGEEDSALSCTYKNPFNDVPEWADRYAAYAYKTGITKGISETEFGFGIKATRQQFAALLLRALSYSEENGDFSYDAADVDGKTYGIITDSVNSDKFLRGDMVIMSYLAVSAKVKGTDKPLSDALIAKGVVTKEALDGAKIIMGEISAPPAKENISSGSSSGSNGGTSNSFGTSSKDQKEALSELPKLQEKILSYYSELSKVIDLVDIEELHEQFDEITALVKQCENVDTNSISPAEAVSYHDNFSSLFDKMEMLAITIAIER